MTDIVGSITTAITLTRQLVDLADAAKDAKAKLLIADLQIQLAEVKMKLAELIEENTSLKAALKKASTKTTDVVIRDGLYFTPDGEGPFCTACFDTTGKLVRVSEMGSVFHDIGKWRCNVCKGHYGGNLK